jgi:hypothetical protein
MGDGKDTSDTSDASEKTSQEAEQTPKAGEAQTRVIDRTKAVELRITPDSSLIRAAEATRTIGLDPTLLRAMESARSIKTDPIIRDIMGMSARRAEITRAALGPLEQLRHSGAFEELKRSTFAASLAMNAIREQFQRPEMLEVARLMEQMRSDMAFAVRPLIAQREELQHAIASMRTSWLDMNNSVRSMRGFAELQGIGAALARMPAFDETFAAGLRAHLGDWRGGIALPKDILQNTSARSAFYEDLGFDPALTAFPVDAFDEAVDVAGLRLPAPVLVESYAISARDDEEEAGFERTNAAHDRLLRFETMLRRFIDELMTRDFGPHWTEKCLPDGMRDDWVDKRDRAQAKGEKPRPLIAYADFTDYEKIVRKKQNWNTTFKGVFQRGEFVTESFQRLYPIRLCTMHARLITADDELYLFVEVKRFLQVIGVLKD